MGRKPRVDRSRRRSGRSCRKASGAGTSRRRADATGSLRICSKDEAEHGAKAALGGEALLRRKPRRTIASGSWNRHLGGSRWRSKS